MRFTRLLAVLSFALVLGACATGGQQPPVPSSLAAPAGADAPVLPGAGFDLAETPSEVGATSSAALLDGVASPGVRGDVLSALNLEQIAAMEMEPITALKSDIAPARDKGLADDGYHPERGDYGSKADRFLLGVYLAVTKGKERYCGCQYNEAKEVSGSCGYDPDSEYGVDPAAADRIEWEHVVPASRMVAAAGCDNRDSCRGERFKSMENDPYNLIPVIGSLNRLRSNSAYADVVGEDRNLGSCDFEIGVDDPENPSRATTYFEPPNNLKGDLSRITFYMAWKHGIAVPADLCHTYVQWAIKDPVSDEEALLGEEIASVVGWDNPYVSGKKLVSSRLCPSDR